MIKNDLEDIDETSRMALPLLSGVGFRLERPKVALRKGDSLYSSCVQHLISLDVKVDHHSFPTVATATPLSQYCQGLDPHLLF